MEDDYQLRPHVEQIRAQLQGAQRALLGHAEAARAAPGWQQLETAPTELPPISEASSHAVSAPPRAVEWVRARAGSLWPRRDRGQRAARGWRAVQS